MPATGHHARAGPAPRRGPPRWSHRERRGQAHCHQHEIDDQPLGPQRLHEEDGAERSLEDRDPPQADAGDEHDQRNAVDQEHRGRVEVG